MPKLPDGRINRQTNRSSVSVSKKAKINKAIVDLPRNVLSDKSFHENTFTPLIFASKQMKDVRLVIKTGRGLDELEELERSRE